MSEVTGTSPPPTSQPSGAERTTPERIAEVRARQEGASTGQQQPGHERPSAEQETPKARFDPAVAVSPSLLDLKPGTELRGDIVRIDGEGRPILETPAAAFALEPDAGLNTADRVVVLIEHVARETRGQILEKNGEKLEAPVEVQLTLTTLHQTPESAALPDSDKDAPPTPPTPGGAASAYPPSFSRSTRAAPFSTDQASALAATPKKPLTTGAEPTGAVKVAAHAGANLAAGAFDVMAEALANVLPTVAGKAVGKPASEAMSAQAATTTATATASSAAGAPVQAARSPLVGQHFQARLVIAAEIGATPGEIAAGQALPGGVIDPRLAGLVPGSPVILTVLATGAEKAGLSQEPVLTGTVTTAEGVAKGTITRSPQSPLSTEEAPAKTGSSGHATAEVRLQYFTFDGGSFMFHGGPQLAIGTPLTVALTRVPETPVEASATARRAAPKPGGGAKVGLTKPAESASNVSGSGPGGPASSGVISETSPASQATPPAGTGAAAAAPVTSASLAPLAPLPPLIGYQESWPVMDELIAAAQAMDATGRAMVGARVPAPGGNLPNTMLFFMTAVGMGQPARWLGGKASQALEAWKGGHLLKQLKSEFGRLARISRDVPGSDWRPFLVPIHTDSGSQAIVILTRPHQDDQRQPDQQPKDDEDIEELSDNQRFLLEVSLSRLGRLQLDGLMRPGRLDLVIRGGPTLSGLLREELRAIFDRVMVGAPIDGSLAFEPLDRSPVDVRDVLAKALPEDHDAHLTA